MRNAQPERPGLRERRRLQTRAEIRDAALDLVRANGFGGVTVEQICARAGVSQRTFFNYFPTKEAAVSAGPPPISDRAVSAFIEAGPAPWSTVFNELVGVLSNHVDDAPPSRQQLAAVLEIAATTPIVHAVMLSEFARHEQELADMVARRCEARSEDEIPAMIATMAMTAIRTGVMRWAQDTAGPDDPDDSPRPYVQQAVATIETIFAV